jgi:hypothetical protein
MDKTALYSSVLAALKEELDATVAAAKDAADYATDEESRAESEWDTQGLEASYLARGQAEHARELMTAIDMTRDLADQGGKVDDSHAHTGSLLRVSIADGEPEWFLLSPAAGGLEIQAEGMGLVTVITPQSPVGHAVVGKTDGATFRLPSGVEGRILRLV